MHVLEADAVARNKAEALLLELCEAGEGTDRGGGYDYYTQQASSVVCSAQCVGRGGANLLRAAMCYRGREAQQDHSTNNNGTRSWASPVEVNK